jgi:hypothetical protein
MGNHGTNASPMCRAWFDEAKIFTARNKTETETRFNLDEA